MRAVVLAFTLQCALADSLRLPLRALPIQDAGQTCSTNKHYKSSKVAGGKVLNEVTVSRPASERDTWGAWCCSIGNGNVGVSEAYTFVDTGPSKTHKDENDYICTVYEADPTDPKGLRFVAANASSTAAAVPFTPDADPRCELKKTMAECWAKPIGSPYSQCAWWGEACHDGPPLECATIPTMGKVPFCLSVALAPGPIPAGSTPSGRPLRPFNWTSGSISGPPSLNVSVMPTQVLKQGDATWWSLEGAGDANWETCVTYQELLADGSGSDPNSAFSACADYDGIGFNLRYGTSSGIHQITGSGLEAAGHPHATSLRVFWVQFAFWSVGSNSTSAPVDDTAAGHSLSLPTHSRFPARTMVP